MYERLKGGSPMCKGENRRSTRHLDETKCFVSRMSAVASKEDGGDMRQHKATTLKLR